MEEEEVKAEYTIHTHLLNDLEKDEFFYLLERLEKMGCMIV